MNYSSIKKDVEEQNLRREKALEAEKTAYRNEIELDCLRRLSKSGFKEAESLVKVLEPQVKVSRANAVLKASKTYLGEDEVKEVCLKILEDYKTILEKKHLSLELDKEELLEKKDSGDEDLEWELYVKDLEQKALNVRHAVVMEKRAAFRGNRATRRKENVG